MESAAKLAVPATLSSGVVLPAVPSVTARMPLSVTFRLEMLAGALRSSAPPASVTARLFASTSDPVNTEPVPMLSVEAPPLKFAVPLNCDVPASDMAAAPRPKLTVPL